MGQFFTKNKKLKHKVYNFIKNKPNLILEPSVGRGDLVKYINKYNSSIKFDCYEIDNNINFIIDKKGIKICDFLKEEINLKYKTIIGNPPYIKVKGGKNIYIKFVSKCFNLLGKMEN